MINKAEVTVVTIIEAVLIMTLKNNGHHGGKVFKHTLRVYEEEYWTKLQEKSNMDSEQNSIVKELERGRRRIPTRAAECCVYHQSERLKLHPIFQ